MAPGAQFSSPVKASRDTSSAGGRTKYGEARPVSIRWFTGHKYMCLPQSEVTSGPEWGYALAVCVETKGAWGVVIAQRVQEGMY